VVYVIKSPSGERTLAQPGDPTRGPDGGRRILGGG